jgi:transcriptional regulator with XRE-family HTH domain
MLQYDRKKLGDHLKEVRERAGLTQNEVSERLGYSSPQFISNIERGVSVAPLDTLAKMNRLYKSKAADMVDIILNSQERLLIEKLRASGKAKKRRA